MSTDPDPHAPVCAVPGVWWIDADRLDEAERTLQQAGRVQRLDRSAFEVLRYLLLHAGEVCTHDELLAAGWPGRIVTANSLTQCISRLRRCLHDVDGQRIAVVHRYGYRLLARVRHQPGEEVKARVLPELSEGGCLADREGWVLRKQVGLGSSGEVWLAVHPEQPARAIKFATDVDGLRSLRREVALHRLIEAQGSRPLALDPLLDANLRSPPFFIATRFHPDGNLAEWAQREDQLARMPPAERLQLAIALVAAVAELHDAGVGHRDLRPHNLYPCKDEEGSWRIVIGDLGNASAALPPGVDALGLPAGLLTLNSDADAAPSLRFHPWLAPEVVAGDSPSRRSDLYALGVMLFQLLHGDLRQGLAPGWREQIDDAQLCEDIELAAHIDPKKRPASARELHLRLCRLDERRSHDRRAAALQQAMQTAQLRERRSRVRARQLALVSLGLGLGLGAALWMGFAALQARDEAHRQSREARAVRSFLTQALLSQANPQESSNPGISLRDALQNAAALQVQQADQPPETAAAIEFTLAEVLDGWSDYVEAARHQARGIALLSRIPGLNSGELAAAERQLCLMLRGAGQNEAAAQACRRALELERLNGRPQPATLIAQAKLRYDSGDCRQAISELNQILATSDVSAVSDRSRADALWFRGLCHTRLGRFAAARMDFAELLPLARQVHGADDPDYGWAHLDFAESLIIEGDLELARLHLNTAGRILERRLGRNHVDSRVVGYQWAKIALFSGKPQRAAAGFVDVLQVWRAKLGEEHLWTLYAESELLLARAEAGELIDRQGFSERLQALRTATYRQLAEKPVALSYFHEVWLRTALQLGEIGIAQELLDRLDTDLPSLDATHPRHGLRHCLAAELALLQAEIGTAARRTMDCSTGLAGLPAGNYRLRDVQRAQSALLAHHAAPQGAAQTRDAGPEPTRTAHARAR